MKKIVLFAFLTLALAFVLTSCSYGGENGKKTDKTASELLDTVLGSVKFPKMVEITDESKLSEMGIDLSLTEDYAAAQQMLSVDVVEVIILKAKDGEKERLAEQLDARKTSLINSFACYPEQVESTSATKTGSERDVVYLICHAEAAEAEAKLIEEIDDDKE